MAVGYLSWRNRGSVRAFFFSSHYWPDEVVFLGLTVSSWFVCFQNTAFRRKVAARWAELRSSSWSSTRIDALYASVSARIKSAVVRNHNRWYRDPNTGLTNSNGCFGCSAQSDSFTSLRLDLMQLSRWSAVRDGSSAAESIERWTSEVNTMKAWLDARLVWMDGALSKINRKTLGD